MSKTNTIEQLDRRRRFTICKTSKQLTYHGTGYYLIYFYKDHANGIILDFLGTQQARAGARKADIKESRKAMKKELKIVFNTIKFKKLKDVRERYKDLMSGYNRD